ncbi:hypothetical protein GCM10022399_42140 [Terrabacter ginsenosidimutans]|uniref:Uncharacterized protein n=1 Tax=Terrabacter ginsenosidimutans TaxID=490575 RepID=A0ABP7ENU3_9MICO
MSTAPIDGRLYAVPAPPQQEQFALLLRLRRAARAAFDTVLALPRGAAGWVLRRVQAVMSALGGNPVLQRLGARLASLGDLLRSAGPVTAAAAVFSIPAVWRATVRLGRFLGSKIASGASALWQQTRSLLGKLGPTGTRMATGLESAGTVVRRVFVAIVTHPVTQSVMRGVAAVAGLVRPVSQTAVLHRLLSRLVGASWMRWTIEMLLLPLVLAPSLLGDLLGELRTTATSSGGSSTRPSPRTTRFVTVPPATVNEERVHSEAPTESEARTAVGEPQNRAERRSAQRAQAKAKRNRIRH